MFELSPIEREFADLCMFFSDGYHTTRARFFLLSIEKWVNEGIASTVEQDFLRMFRQFSKFTQLVKEGKI